MAKLNRVLLLAAVAFVAVLVLVYIVRAPARVPRWIGKSAMLPCLANSQCPMGHTCMNGFCAEGFQNEAAVDAVGAGPSVPVIMSSSRDTSSCSAKECKGINAPCERRATPCPEGTFCQGGGCMRVTAPDQGEAYKQIGMLLD